MLIVVGRGIGIQVFPLKVAVLVVCMVGVDCGCAWVCVNSISIKCSMHVLAATDN